MCNVNWDEPHQLKIACIWYYRFYVKGNRISFIRLSVLRILLPHFFSFGWWRGEGVSINLPSITNLCINTNEIPRFVFRLRVPLALCFDESENRSGVSPNCYDRIYKLYHNGARFAAVEKPFQNGNRIKILKQSVCYGVKLLRCARKHIYLNCHEFAASQRNISDI